jgi:glutathione synthase
MSLLFVADPLEAFKTYKDTTFAMMREAARRGRDLLACTPSDLVWRRGGRVTATAARAFELTGKEEDWFRVREQRECGIAHLEEIQPPRGWRLRPGGNSPGDQQSSGNQQALVWMM